MTYLRTVETHLLAALVVQVLGTVKNALVVWMGILFLADVVTPLQVGPQYRALFYRPGSGPLHGNMSSARHVHFFLALRTSDAGVRTCSRCSLQYGMRRALATPSASWASSGIITSRCSPRPRPHMLRSLCGILMGQQSPEADGSCGVGPNEGFEGDWPG